MTSPYDPRFYEAVREGARRSAECIVPLVLDLVAPASVVDIGCGDGTWLAAFAARGIVDYLGLDGDYVDLKTLAIPRERFAATDLTMPLTLGRSFDLAVSLEVAEHLPPERAEAFVASLCAAAPAVLFSAAVPHQGGRDHRNERWPEYWAGLFAARGYLAADAIRDRIWDEPAVDWWYAQNTIVYARSETLAARPDLRVAAARTDAARLTRIHPRNYERIGELIAEKERRRNRFIRRVGRFLRG
ncbi:MAG TPA: class I SAM-dependent methyltransferase [Candidatus Polarisedimenticolaceae bacterium]|nr:class I SAM-dependent methyltransferase [Candidatus Polarisedimenticolaceae bacterium]